MLIQLVATILAIAGIGFIGLITAWRAALPYSLILVLLGFATSFLLAPLGWDAGFPIIAALLCYLTYFSPVRVGT